MKIGDLVYWHVTLDHVVLKSEIGKIVVGEFCTVCVCVCVCVCVYIYIYICIWKVAVVASSDVLIMNLPGGSDGNDE